jgi:hypothetical protein
MMIVSPTETDFFFIHNETVTGYKALALVWAESLKPNPPGVSLCYDNHFHYEFSLRVLEWFLQTTHKERSCYLRKCSTS